MSTTEPRYVRFGYLPRNGRSRYSFQWRSEAGVSCYPGDMREGGRFFVDTSGLTDESGLAGLVLFCALDRPAFFVEGEEVGVGTDGEPLLRVERRWPVPADVDLTSYGGDTQPALELWSRGPRDDSGRKRAKQRLTDPDLGYIPSDFRLSPKAAGQLESIPPTKKPKGTQADHKRKAQKQARKKQRAKKK